LVSAKNINFSATLYIYVYWLYAIGLYVYLRRLTGCVQIREVSIRQMAPTVGLVRLQHATNNEQQYQFAAAASWFNSEIAQRCRCKV